jgi:hypothetical protein
MRPERGDGKVDAEDREPLVLRAEIQAHELLGRREEHAGHDDRRDRAEAGEDDDREGDQQQRHAKERLERRYHGDHGAG